MNPYELADELKKCVDDGFTDLVCVCDAVNMLRQQADRIAELEKEKIGAYDNGFEDGRKSLTTNAKPVAWTNQKWLNVIAKEPQLFQPLFVHGKQTEHNTIPLYTTPQINERCEPLCKPSVCNCTKKELSDIEITEMFYHPDNRYEDTGLNYIKFARAILKKASEK